MKLVVVEFPGSHGAEDVLRAYQLFGMGNIERVWHEADTLGKPDAVIIPGGYSFGDYLRPGALAIPSPISGPIRKFAQDGGPVLGIGNGFQILCELGLLPGALLENLKANFINQRVTLRVETNKNAFLTKLTPGSLLRLPVAHYFGRYYADRRTIKTLEEQGLVAFRYVNEEGEPTLPDSLNGSINSIAGILGRHGNVLGLMAHPERAVEEAIGGEDGKLLLSSILP